MSRQSGSTMALILFCLWLAIVAASLIGGGTSVIAQLDVAFSAAFGKWGDVALMGAAMLGLIVVPMEIIHRVTRGAMAPDQRAEADEIAREVNSGSFAASLLQVCVAALVVMGVLLALGVIK